MDKTEQKIPTKNRKKEDLPTNDTKATKKCRIWLLKGSGVMGDEVSACRRPRPFGPFPLVFFVPFVSLVGNPFFSCYSWAVCAVLCICGGPGSSAPVFPPEAV